MYDPEDIPTEFTFDIIDNKIIECMLVKKDNVYEIYLDDRLIATVVDFKVVSGYLKPEYLDRINERIRAIWE